MTELFCPACGAAPDAWAPGPGGRPAARCPTCHSLERHRLLVPILRSAAAAAPRPVRVVLDFAPAGQVHDLLHTTFPDSAVIGLDLLEPDRDIDLLADMTRLPLDDGVADLVLCYHVLEHITDDAAAMAELRRVTAPGGLLVAQVPFRPGRPTDEDPDAPPDVRAERFGQTDHVRWYGADFDDRLEAAGWDVRRLAVRQVTDDSDRARYGLATREWVWLAVHAAGGLQWRRAMVDDLTSGLRVQ